MKRSLWVWIICLLLLAVGGAYFLHLRGEPITRDTRTGPIGCAYPDRGARDVELSDDCGTVDGSGTLQLNKELLRKIDFGTSEPVCLMAPVGRAFYADRNGRTYEVYPFDNSCDGFNEGLARSPSKHGTRFIDKKLREAITTSYQFAMPFNDGFAVVCNDVRYRRALNDEHGQYVGGKCGFIDRKGALVVPLQYPFDEIYVHNPTVR